MGLKDIFAFINDDLANAQATCSIILSKISNRDKKQQQSDRKINKSYKKKKQKKNHIIKKNNEMCTSS